jgi:hypothetical protein
VLICASFDPPRPPTKEKKLGWKVYYPSGKCIVDTPLSTPSPNLKPPHLLLATHKKKQGEPFTPCCAFSLVAWKFYS